MTEKGFSGNLFERFNGLDYVLDRCSGCTVLDIGSCEGLIGYEFARHGAALIHGFERNIDRVLFSQRLFRYVPVESEFHEADFALSVEQFSFRFRDTLLAKYDIVLFLGIYHNLKHQKSQAELNRLVEYLLAMTGKWFVVRTNLVHEIVQMISDDEFSLVGSSLRTDKVGTLHIYERVK